VLVVVVVVGLVDVVVSSVVVVLVCANANGATSPQTKAIIVFFILSSFLIKLPPQFVIRGSNGRSLAVLSLQLPSNVVIQRICDFSDLSGRREFGNMGRQ
jgi:TRAP-type uncharacterized transport system fused permease subunit